MRGGWNKECVGVFQSVGVEEWARYDGMREVRWS